MKREDFRLVVLVMIWAFVAFLFVMGVIGILNCTRGEQTEKAPQGAVAVETIQTPLLVAARGAAVSRDTLVVPGESIGRYRLDWWSVPRFVIETGWGQPTITVVAPESLVDGRKSREGLQSGDVFFHHAWRSGPGAGFRVVTLNHREGNIFSISVRAPEGAALGFRTQSGIGFDSTAADVLRVYGSPSHSWSSGNLRIISYRERGLKFTVLRTRDPERARMVEIWVFRPTTR
jgi:hypothetical protein